VVRCCTDPDGPCTWHEAPVGLAIHAQHNNSLLAPPSTISSASMASAGLPTAVVNILTVGQQMRSWSAGLSGVLAYKGEMRLENGRSVPVAGWFVISQERVCTASCPIAASGADQCQLAAVGCAVARTAAARTRAIDANAKSPCLRVVAVGGLTTPTPSPSWADR
jgi:hypothetical protein